MIKAIIPFRIKIERIEAKAKLSQNHSKERREKVIRHLEYSNSENDQTIATWMRKFINR
jgi:transcriptional regulator